MRMTQRFIAGAMTACSGLAATGAGAADLNLPQNAFHYGDTIELTYALDDSDQDSLYLVRAGAGSIREWSRPRGGPEDGAPAPVSPEPESPAIRDGPETPLSETRDREWRMQSGLRIPVP